MKTLAINGLAMVLSALVAAPALPLSYEIDIGGEGSFETVKKEGTFVQKLHNIFVFYVV